VAHPFLSVIVPTLNEEADIEACLSRLRQELETHGTTWEIVVSDDGSTDRTRPIVEACAAADSRIRCIAAPHEGKGAAVRRGLLAATGQWRFMADADLSMPPDNLRRFLEAIGVDEASRPEIVIGSREAPGAQRVGEPWTRHAIGRVFNWIVRLFAVPGIRDTQCGYKLFSARAAATIAPRLTLPGFAFDVELLHLARQSGFPVREVGIVWNCRADSRVRIGRGAAAFADVLRIRWRHRERIPRPRLWAYACAAVIAAAVSADLLRMPVQVSDALIEIVEASESPSATASFKESMSSSAYLRPLRIAQIKALFDLGGDHLSLTYRVFHALLLTAALLLFARAMRVTTGRDLVATVVALTVMTGLHTFLGTVKEAFPINHFLEIAVLCLLALNLAQSKGGWLPDVAAVAAFVTAALTLESGLLVWVVAAAAYLAGLRGISTRGLATMTAMLAGYFYLRVVHLDTGVPALSERSAGYLFTVLDPPQLQAQFGDRLSWFYAYNVIASVFSVLFSEPQNGVFLATRGWVTDRLLPSMFLGLASSVPTTAVVVWAALSSARRPAGHRPRLHLFVVAGAVLMASALLSFAYTKDEVMSAAGMFYALAVGAAMIELLDRAATMSWPSVCAVAAIVAVASTAWTVRSIGVHHVLAAQAFKHRNDWAELPGAWQRSGLWPTEPQQQALVLRLRADALARRPPNPGFLPRWGDDVWGD
jgi:dolichyl-phosphate beta-glucosyltransferase